MSYVGPGRIAAQSYGNGTALSKAAGGTTIGAGYDASGRSIEHAWFKTSGNVLVTEYLSTYNALHRRTSETRTHLFGNVDTYVLDSAQRMLEFEATDYSGMTPVTTASERELNGLDKMLSFSDEGTAKNPTISGGLHQYTSFGGGTRTWDHMGGLIGDETGKGYQYDALGRLTTVWSGAVGSSTVVSTTTYDALDRRTTKTTGSSDVRYVYAGAWQVVEERDLSSTELLRQYVTGQRIDELIQMRDTTGSSDARYWYHTNSQGFVGALTDIDGDVVEYYEYSMLGRPTVLSPNGTALGPVSTVGNPYSFQAREYDAETGWFQFRFRNYDPSVGEFVSVDPSGLWRHGQGNGYSAFSGNEWNVHDPLGLHIVTIGGAFDSMTDAGERGFKELRDRQVALGQNDMRFGFTERERIVEIVEYWWNVHQSDIDESRRTGLTPSPWQLTIAGHSLGGETAIQVVNDLKRLGIPVNILVTVDPVTQNRLVRLFMRHQWTRRAARHARLWINVLPAMTPLDRITTNIPLLGPALGGLCGFAACAFIKHYDYTDAIATAGGKYGPIRPEDGDVINISVSTCGHNMVDRLLGFVEEVMEIGDVQWW
jgi:RHS repeat-associated protein